MSEQDVVVVGAGPSGCSSAITLARQGVRVLLIGSPGRPSCWPGESLPPGAGELVSSLFGSMILSVPPHQIAVGTRASWGSDELIETDFLANPLGMGWHLQRGPFDAQLLKSASDQGVSVLNRTRVRRVERDPSGWRITCQGSGTQHARWLVDATGRAAVVLRQLGIPRHSLDQQVAQIAVLDSSESADSYHGTTVEAAREGWWYSTPLPNGRRILAWMTDRDHIRPRHEREKRWQKGLTETRHMARIAGPAALSAVPRLYPANTSYRARLFGERWMAVGDAAITLDPLSSQGIITGLLMGAKSGPAIASALEGGTVKPLLDWERDYQMLLAEHQSLRAFYAGGENRWPESRYWKRRRFSSRLRNPAMAEAVTSA